MIIAGDIGGTKTVLALYALEAGKLKLIRQAVFPSKGPKSLEEILEKFLVDEKKSYYRSRLLWCSWRCY